MSAIVCWRHEWNGAELAHTPLPEDETVEDSLRSSIARLVDGGKPLDLWRCSAISTPETVLADVARRGSLVRPHSVWEGELAADILDELDQEV